MGLYELHGGGVAEGFQPVKHWCYKNLSLYNVEKLVESLFGARPLWKQIPLVLLVLHFSVILIYAISKTDDGHLCEIYLLMLGGMNLKSFERYFTGFSYGENVVDAKTIFNQLTKKKDKNAEKIITVQDVINFSREDLKLLGRAMDPPHGPKTVAGEEVFFLPGEALDNEHIFSEDERKRAHEIKENFDDDVQRILQAKKVEL